MSSFGRSPALVHDGQSDTDFAWLAGVMEAEGTFVRPIPSEPRWPIVACQMTDQDVVERVASTFGTTVVRIPRDSRRRVTYGTRLKGSRAALLMQDLAPIMSERRCRAIEAALDGYSPPHRKLDFAAAETIRDLYLQGISVSGLARTHSVARSTIRQILDRSIYRAPPATPWRQRERMTDVPEPAGDMSPCEIHWLAGWLEGEGSFSRPPPSDPRRPRIIGKTRDLDVATEVGRLLGVSPVFSHDRRERRRGWSPMWRLLGRGRSAVRLMRVLHPLMGARRQSQIERALAAVGLGVEAAGVAPASAESVPMCTTSVPVGV